MSAIDPSFIPVNKMDMGSSEAAAGIHLVKGENVKKGDLKQRVTLNIFDEIDKNFAKIHVREDQPFINLGRWVPLKIKVEGEDKPKTVYVNVNSLKSRLGISKSVAQELIDKHDDGSGLAKILNRMKDIRERMLEHAKEKPKPLITGLAIKTVNFIEKNKKEWAKEAPGKGQSFTVQHGGTKQSAKATVDFFNSNAITVPLYEVGKGGFKTFNAAYNYEAGETVVTAAIPEQEFERYQKLKDIPGLVPTHAIAKMTLKDGKASISEPKIAQTKFNSDLEKAPGIGKVDLNGVINSLCTTVSKLHEKGYAHRDIKPGNIFTNDFSKVFLGDIGLACTNPDDENELYEKVGTMPYLSPEMITADISTLSGYGLKTLDDWRRSDIWALGCTLYEVALGKNTPLAEDYANIMETHGKDKADDYLRDEMKKLKTPSGQEKFKERIKKNLDSRDPPLPEDHKNLILRMLEPDIGFRIKAENFKKEFPKLFP